MEVVNRVMEVIVLLVALGIIAFSAQRIHRYKEDLYTLLPILALGTHTAIFYIVQIIAAHSGQSMSSILGIENVSQTWSLVLRLHTLWTLITMIYININCKRALTWMKR